MPINNLRDAEAKIRDLERQLEELRTDVRKLKMAELESNVTPKATQNSEGVPDYVVSADRTNIIHKVLHIFDRLKAGDVEFNDVVARDIDARSLDLRGLDAQPQIHISNDTTDQGTYIMNLANNTYVLSGAFWDGSNWIAKNTIAIMLVFNSSTGFRFNFNTGLVVGNSFSPTMQFAISPTGSISTKITASRFIMTDGSSILVPKTVAEVLTELDVYTKTEVNTAIAAAVAGKANTGMYSVSVVAVGNHSHGGAVGADGAHGHTASVTL